MLPLIGHCSAEEKAVTIPQEVVKMVLLDADLLVRKNPMPVFQRPKEVGSRLCGGSSDSSRGRRPCG